MITKVLLLDSGYPINVRNKKILEALNKFEEFDLSVISWNRNNSKLTSGLSCMEYIYNSVVPYGNKVKKLLGLYGYSRFVKRKLSDLKPDVIIASHWDMLFLAAFLKKRNVRLIYENLDIPTASNRLVLKFLKFLEKLALRKTNGIIFASRFYLPLYSAFNKEKIIIENKPWRSIQDDKPIRFEHKTDKLKISFIGGLRYFEVMKNLITAAEDLPIDILFFGDGPDLNKFKKFSSHLNNVFFFGRYDYGDVKSIYALTDIVWAVYPSKDSNVKYAISNKFFESIALLKPGFFASNTELGNHVFEEGIGFSVDPYDIDSINSYFRKIIADETILLQVTKKISLYTDGNELYWDDSIVGLKRIIKG